LEEYSHCSCIAPKERLTTLVRFRSAIKAPVQHLHPDLHILSPGQPIAVSAGKEAPSASCFPAWVWCSWSHPSVNADSVTRELHDLNNCLSVLSCKMRFAHHQELGLRINWVFISRAFDTF
jgi:hypothetical protein